jgi:hypothetical protein
MPKKAANANPFTGRWRIVSMSAWDRKFNDEMDPAQGRGWAVMKGDELHGMIFIHNGDDSEFVAKKTDSRKKAKK